MGQHCYRTKSLLLTSTSIETFPSLNFHQKRCFKFKFVLQSVFSSPYLFYRHAKHFHNPNTSKSLKITTKIFSLGQDLFICNRNEIDETSSLSYSTICGDRDAGGGKKSNLSGCIDLISLSSGKQKSDLDNDTPFDEISCICKTVRKKILELR